MIILDLLQRKCPFLNSDRALSGGLERDSPPVSKFLEEGVFSGSSSGTMKLQSNLPRQRPWIFAAPFMNAGILLLICFLAKSGIHIDSPESTSLLTGFDRAHVITIPSGSAAAIYFDGQPVSTEGLVALLKEHRDGERRAIIYHDRMAPGGRLVEVTTLAHQNGYAVALATVSPQQ